MSHVDIMYWKDKVARLTPEERTVRLAPQGAIWVCGACGKTAWDRYGLIGDHSSGWDESCMLNAKLCGRPTNYQPGMRVTHAEPFPAPQPAKAGP